MPIVEVKMVEGRTHEQLADMIREVTDAIERSLGVPRETVRIMIHEMQEHQYAVGGNAWPVVKRARERD